MTEGIKPLLKSVHRTVKDVSRIIAESPWGHLAVQKENTMLSPSGGSSNQVVAMMQPRNGIAYTPVSSEPVGAASTGYVTPLPATPLSAALGPAALATVPVIPPVPPIPANATAYYSNGVGLDRSRSVSRRRI